MKQDITRVAITGAAGQIAYNLLFRIASGEMLGQNQKVALHLLEIPQAENALKGVVMELNDCAYPLLEEVRFGSDPKEVFKEVDIALLVGSKPRGPGMERGDLLKENGKIFIGQGQALNEVASKDVKVFVVGNPCNTNCLICMNSAPNIPRENFHAMTRLDQNRLQYQLANKAGTAIKNVQNTCIWGNHSATQVPDFVNATIDGVPVAQAIDDQAWLESELLTNVQKRGAAIIEARGKSSAASAANALLDEVKSHFTKTPNGQWFSTCVCSDGNPYGIEENLIFSFPCRSEGNGDFKIVADIPWNDFLKSRIQETEKELISEREQVSELMEKQVNV